MGERKRKLKEVVVAVKGTLDEVDNHGAPMSVATPGGRIQVQWDTRANATAMGQLTFFANFSKWLACSIAGLSNVLCITAARMPPRCRCPGHMAAVDS